MNQRMLQSPHGRAVIALMLVLLLGVIFNADGAFFKIGTHRDALRQASVFGILACGMTIVILAGGIDLSVGSVMALVAVMFSLMAIHWGWSWAIAIPLSLLVGILITIVILRSFGRLLVCVLLILYFSR